MKFFKRLTRHLRPTKTRARRTKYFVFISLVIGLTLAAYFGAVLISNSRIPTPASRLVTFHDRGQDRVILTHATSVADALKDAQISVDPKDDVEPAINSSLSSTDAAVIIYRARPVLVIDGAFRERILTPAQSPNEIAKAIGIDGVGDKDQATITNGNFVDDGASTILTIKRATPEPVAPVKVAFAPTAQALTKSRGAQLWTDSSGVTHRETYYDLLMNIVITACGPSDYTIRYDGAKVDKDGYVLVAANYGVYPRCSVVETSMGPGKVYDTGGFATRYPHGFDLATDWTNYDGR